MHTPARAISRCGRRTKQNDDQRLNTDFLAIIDADPRSATYGKVVKTASVARVGGANLLNDLGFTGPLGLTTKYNLPGKGIPSNVLNEAHHRRTSRSWSGGTAISIWAA